MKKCIAPILLAFLTLCVLMFAPQSVKAIDTDRYGYALLDNEQQKELYTLLADALADCAQELSLSGKNFKQSDLIMVEQMIRRDYPEFFYYQQCSYSMTQDGTVHSIEFHYALNGEYIHGDSEILKTAIAVVDAKVREITKNVTGSDYDKALYLHDYIVESTDYINTINDQTAYGALIDQKAVCAGYTHAYQMLLREVGIESFYVTGISKGMPHAWLLVFLDGDCYYTDVTWDDPLTQDGSNMLGHYYFDMSFDDISKDHTFDDEFYDWLPEKHDHHELYFYEYEAKEGSGIGWFNSDSTPSELYKYLKKVGNTYVCNFRFDGNDASVWLGEAANYAAREVGAVSASFRQVGSEYSLTLTLPEPTVIASGTCGDNLTWTLDSEGTLTISGSGAMEDYDYNRAPWNSNCNSIKSVVINDGVTSIGSYAFYECSNLTGISIPDGVTSLAERAFWKCDKLTSITIPDSVTSIGDSVFFGCSNLASITIPNGVTSIGHGAFYGCSSLTSITIPDGVTDIDDSMFFGCSNLTSITIPNGVTRIGCGAFEGCINLTSVAVPDSVTVLGDTAFSGCTSLTSVTIGNGMRLIGFRVFYSCDSLTEVFYGDNNAHWDMIEISGDNESLTNATIFYTDINCPDNNNDGKCDICGATVPVSNSNAKFATTGLSLGEFIGLQSAVMKKNLNGGNFDEAYFIYTHHTFDENGNPIEVTERAAFIDAGNFFVADCKVNAKQMSDVFEITPYYVENGVTYYGTTTTTSVKAEVMKLLAKSTTDDKTKALCVAMLNYGAEAQKKFAYNLDNLANSELSASQKVLPAFGDLNLKKNNTIPTTPYKPGSSGLSLSEVVYMQFLMPMSKVDANGELQYQILGEDLVKIKVSDLEIYGSYYVISIPIKAKNVRSNIYIGLYNAQGVRDYGYMICSVEAFAKTLQGSANENLVAALMAYGDAAKAVFGG